jgi:hypothetical protein
VSYQTAKEIGEIVVLIGPQLVIIGAAIGMCLAIRRGR